jgi:hypothetical protein
MSDNMVLEKMTKKELLVLATAHSDFKKSMSREKKEVLIHFLRSHQGGVEFSSTAPTVTKDIEGAPVPPQAVKKTLSRQTKPELLELCQKTPGFDCALHGKTRLTMLQFLKTPLVEEEGTDPVNVGTFLDTPDDVGVIKAAILRLLMDAEPFKADPELEAKLDKIV